MWYNIATKESTMELTGDLKKKVEQAASVRVR